MILDDEALIKYRECKTKEIEEAMKNDHIIHGYMVYKCEHCHNVYVMWLEKGLEDPTDDLETGKHKPVPFGFPCLVCGGEVQHTLWSLGRDSYGKNYRSYQEYINQENKPIYRNFFWNDPKSNYGKPIVFEPDYCGENLRNYNRYIAEIYINTLSDEQYKKFNSLTISVLDGTGVIISPTYSIREDVIGSLEFDCTLERRPNREQRRHGAFGNNSYKRPRKNKKLYEY